MLVLGKVMLDVEKMVVVFDNLFLNVIDFSLDGGEVWFMVNWFDICLRFECID